MPETFTLLEPWERIQLFIQCLIQENLKCRSSYEANAHIRDCLNEIEEVYGRKGRMSVPKLKRFVYKEHYKFYFYETRSHFTIIHINGAYAIYKKKLTESPVKDFFFYKEGTPLVGINSKKGSELWSDFDEIVKQVTNMKL